MNILSQQDDWSRGRKEGKVIHNNIWKTLAWIFINVTANLAWQPWWLTLFFWRFPTLEMTNRNVVQSTALNVSPVQQLLGPHANYTGTAVPFYSFTIDRAEVFTRINILDSRHTENSVQLLWIPHLLWVYLSVGPMPWSMTLLLCFIFSLEIAKISLKWLIHLIFDGYKSTPVIMFFGW